jgi:hypothetical protein
VQPDAGVSNALPLPRMLLDSMWAIMLGGGALPHLEKEGLISSLT